MTNIVFLTLNVLYFRVKERFLYIGNMQLLFLATSMDSTAMVGCTYKRLLHVKIRMYFQSDQDGIDSETYDSLPKSYSNIYESISSEVLTLVGCTCKRLNVLK